MTRTSRPLALALLAAAAACGTPRAETCPGAAVGVFTFVLEAPDTGEEPRPFCARVPAEGTTVVGTFRAVLSSDPALGTAAVCVEGGRDLTQAYYGRVDGGAYAVSTSPGLAVLQACGPNCAAEATARIEGSVVEGAFDGSLTERFQHPRGDCGGCAFPCEAAYGLTGTPVP